MNVTKRAIRDQASLVAAYHFTLALAFLIGGAATFVYAILPALGNGAENLPQRLFSPVTGLLLCTLLVALYTRIGIGLKNMNNGSRMAAIYMAMTGIIGGIFGMSGTIFAAINGLGPDWIGVALFGATAVSVYLLTSSVDLIILVFLMKREVQLVFYGESIGVEAEVATRKEAQTRSTNHSKEPVREAA